MGNDVDPPRPGSMADRRADGPAKVECRACSHPKDAHEHHRRGTDCSQSACTCVAWKRPVPRLLAFLAR